MVELVAAGSEPRAPAVKTFDASAHVVLPGLINTHHHFYQTLTRAVPAALDRELFPWLQALYPLWARLTPEAVELASTLAVAELMLSGCTLTTDHHYVLSQGRRRQHRYPGRRGEAARLARAANARLDEPLAARRRIAAGQRGAGRGDNPRTTVSVWSRATIRPATARKIQDRACTMLAVFRHHVAHARDRRIGRTARRAHAHAPRRNRGREPLLLGDPSVPAARLSGGMRLAERSDVAGAWRAFEHRRVPAPRPRRNGRHALRLQQPDAGVRHLPGLRNGRGGRRGRPWRVDGSASNDSLRI